MTTPYLALGSANNVLIYRRDTTTALTYVTTFSVGASRTITGISWSPNGLYLAVSYNVSPYLNVYKYGGSVGSETFTLLAAPATAYLPSVHTAWSSDSSRLVNSAYTTSGGYGSPVMQFYNMASDVLTYDRQITGYSRAQGRIKMSADNKYLYGVAVNDGNYAEIFSQSGLDYVRTNFYSSVGANGSGVHVSGNLFTVGGSYGTPFRMFDNTSGTPVEFTYPGSGVAPYGGYAPITPDRSYVAVAEDNTDGTVANQLKLYSISGTTLTLATGAASQPTAINSDGYTIATDAEWTSDGTYLAIGLYESTTAGAAPFFAWYSRSGGTLTKLTNPSTMPSAIVRAAAWTDPYTPPPPTITLNGTLASDKGYFQQGPVLANAVVYFLQGAVLNNDAALFQQGNGAKIAATLADTGAIFAEGDDGFLHSTLSSAIASFLEGDSGRMVSALAPSVASFQEGDDGSMRSVLGNDIGGFSFHLGEQVDGDIFELLTTHDGALGNLNTTVTVTELANVVASTMLAFNLNISEVLSLAATVDGTRVLIATVADQMVVAGVASTNLNALHMIAEAVRLYDVADRAFVEQINELLSLQDVSAAQVAALVEVIESLVLDEEVSASVLVVTAISENMSLADQALTQAVLQNLLADGIVFELTFASDFGIYETWVINTQTGAPSTYTAFNFNSYASKRGLSLGASDAGLFQLDSDDDGGQNIPASFTTGKLRFGTSQLKNVPSVYVAFNASGKMALKVVSEQNGKPIERWFKLEGAGGSAREGRFKLGRGDKSPYWQFTLSNMQGSDFEIDQMDYDVIRLSRRI